MRLGDRRGACILAFAAWVIGCASGSGNTPPPPEPDAAVVPDAGTADGGVADATTDSSAGDGSIVTQPDAAGTDGEGPTDAIADTATPISPTGLTWPDGQAFPTFAPPAATLDVVNEPGLVGDSGVCDMCTLMVTLEGLINRTQPRIWLSYGSPGPVALPDRGGNEPRRRPALAHHEVQLGDRGDRHLRRHGRRHAQPRDDDRRA